MILNGCDWIFCHTFQTDAMFVLCGFDIKKCGFNILSRREVRCFANFAQRRNAIERDFAGTSKSFGEVYLHFFLISVMLLYLFYRYDNCKLVFNLALQLKPFLMARFFTTPHFFFDC